MRTLATLATLAAPAALACLLLLPGAARAQEDAEELRRLRQATSLEVRGRYDEAREVLEQILRENATSSAALFSLERVLRPLGRVREVLPWADRHLESAPRAAGVRYLVLRILSEVDSVAALEPAVAAWIEADPASPEPYVEGARVLEESVGAAPALALLRRGSEVLADADGVAAELGDVLLRAGEKDAAAAAWARAVGADGEGTSSVLRRLSRLGDERARVAGAVVDRLDDEPTTVDRRRAGVRIAVAAGLEERAVALADRVAGELDGAELGSFLSGTAASAREAGLPAVETWAWTVLARATAGERERRALDARIAASALAAGDTAAAVAAQVRLARSLPVGSAERRRAVADLLRVEARWADAATLRERLEGFRAEFPDAPELDELASSVASGLRARGHGEEAAGALAGVQGPRSSLERAYLLFETDSVAAGVDALLAAVGGLEPARATGVIQLANLLDRLGPGAAAHAARSAALAHRGAGDEALATLRDGLGDAGADDRPLLLAHGARLADALGRPDDAAALRRRLLEQHPDAAEAAEAGLALARWHARSPDGVATAVTLLEELILARPGSPVVPVARRELERLRSGGSDSGGGP